VTSSTGRFAIDANILLRFLLQDHPDYSVKARRIMEAVQAGEIAVFCDPLIIGEVVWVLKSTYKVAPPTIAKMLGPLVLAERFIVPDKERYVRALELYGTTIPHFGDACACAAALEECKGRLLSFDKSLSRVEGVQRAEEP